MLEVWCPPTGRTFGMPKGADVSVPLVEPTFGTPKVLLSRFPTVWL